MRFAPPFSESKFVCSAMVRDAVLPVLTPVTECYILQHATPRRCLLCRGAPEEAMPPAAQKKERRSKWDAGAPSSEAQQQVVAPPLQTSSGWEEVPSVLPPLPDQAQQPLPQPPPRSQQQTPALPEPPAAVLDSGGAWSEAGPLQQQPSQAQQQRQQAQQQQQQGVVWSGKLAKSGTIVCDLVCREEPGTFFGV